MTGLMCPSFCNAELPGRPILRAIGSQTICLYDHLFFLPWWSWSVLGPPGTATPVRSVSWSRSSQRQHCGQQKYIQAPVAALAQLVCRNSQTSRHHLRACLPRLGWHKSRSRGFEQYPLEYQRRFLQQQQQQQHQYQQHQQHQQQQQQQRQTCV
jgi:hypothetical protein